MRNIVLILSLFFFLSLGVFAFAQADFQTKMQFAQEHRHKTSHPGFPGCGLTDADSSHSWDALHYHIEMEFFPSSQQIDAVVTITGLCKEAGLDTLPLHLAPGFDVDNITSGGQNVGYRWQGQDFLVELDRSYSLGDTIEVVVDYSGNPPHISNPNSLGGMGIFWGNVIYTYTDPEGARAFFPCYDKPFDKATYTAQYTLPSAYIMASNGHLDSTIVNPNQTKTTYWTHNYPIETYLISISASNYSQFNDTAGDIPLQYYVYPSHLSAAQIDFQPLPDMILCYETFFGEYPFEKYGMAEGPIFGGGGAMEHQTMTSLGNGIISGTGSGEFLYAHELAHMWFGDAISVVDWPHIWLSEGFATYSEPLWAKYRYGEQEFISYIQSQQNSYFGWENSTNRHSIYNPPPGYLFSTVEYEKAGCVLNMLNYYLGEDNFFDMMREYFNTYKYGCASTDDFQEKCEEYYGGDLDWFFDQWVYGEGYPVFDYLTAYSEISPGTYEIILQTEQTQYPEVQLFSTDIDVCIFSGGLPQHTETIHLENQSDICVFNYSGPQPDSIVLDPEYWILARKNSLGMLDHPIFSGLSAQWISGFIYQWTVDSLICSFENTGTMASNLRGSITTSDPFLSISYNQISFGNVGFMEQISNSFQPVPAFLGQLAPSHYAEIELRLEWDYGDTVLEFSVPVGNPTVLYVDDDDSPPSGLDIASVLDTLMIVHRNWDNQLSGLPSDFYGYQAVIWDCGHSQTPLYTAETVLLSDYLDSGGRLIMNGINLASANPNNMFLSNYMGLQYQSATTLPGIYGVAGDPVSQDIQLFLNTNQTGQDIVAPMNGGIVCYKYMGTSPAGIRMESNYKSIALAFDLADVRWDLPSFNSPDEALAGILAWMDVIVGVENRTGLLPQNCYLDVCPNPFNPTAVIEFNIVMDMPVDLRIYNTLGQQAAVLIENEVFPAGKHSLEFDAKSLPSGLYFVRLKTQNSNIITKKIILLK